MFNSDARNDYSPISMIVTTHAAYLYHGEPEIYSALTEIVTQLHAHAVLVEDTLPERRITNLKLIQRKPDGKWYIGNPVNPEENFADRWHEDNHARARAFFSWVARLKEDLIDVLRERWPESARTRLIRALGASVTSGHLDIIAAVAAPTAAPPRIQISERPRPWKV